MLAFIFGATVAGLILLGALVIYAERVDQQSRLELHRRSAEERQRMFDASLERIRTRRRQRKEDTMGARGQSPPSSTREASAE